MFLRGAWISKLWACDLLFSRKVGDVSRRHRQDLIGCQG